MQVARSIEDLRLVSAAPLSVTIGNFDGVHLGHAAVLSELVTSAARAGTQPAAVTFEPHPLSVLGSMDRPFVLTPAAEKADLMAAAGVAALLVLEFDRALAEASATQFLADLGIGPGAHLVLGYDFRMGHGRETDLAALSRLASEQRFALHVVPPIMHAGARISSSRIRQALWRGDAGDAAAMLGRPYRLEGQVVRGDGLGARLGYPTANLSLSPEKLLPADGVYVASVCGERRLPGLLYVGRRPTMGRGERRAEVHVLDGPGVPYGAPLAVDVLERLRCEMAFEGTGDLAEQIGRDVEAARKLRRLRD